ncbi:ester hydrolase C11orf54 homolog [Condylostylus longicornis]|uniref:ester hydrolase C11orf54 homolog n=1 Tax=Condylostylus longicornis TaxID=2530218 RepID=UPI00244E3FCB|nr:ester hydrolase C11orf54 homolog [Condylostylus longicornis]
MSFLKTEDLLFETKELFVPKLEEIQEVLQEALRSNFDQVTVEVVDCPNLKNDPYYLADSGLCGSPTLVEVGGPPYLLPLVDTSKIYDITEIAKRSIGKESTNILICGAGAGPHMIHDQNCEGIYNMKIENNGSIKNCSYLARVVGVEEKCALEKLPDTEKRFALLANLFACEGKPGKVLRVHCKKRIGQLNFITSIRIALQNFYKEKCVGLGGLFLIKSGMVYQHVMRHFSTTPINTEDQLNNWLKFYEMPAVLNAVGTLITNENDLDLRLQHFHSFSNTNWGGHYHYDTTPENVEYEGFFNVGEQIVRVDRPRTTHKFGRD